METTLAPRWRSWLLLILCAGGALIYIGAAVFLFTSGSILKTDLPTANLVTLSNLAWFLLPVAALCIPAVVLSIRDLSRTVPLPARPRNRFRLASICMLLWISLVAVFKVLENSNVSGWFLSLLILIATLIPLWWFVEYARRGVVDRQPTRTWKLAGFSLAVTVPATLVVSSLVLVALLIGAGVYIAVQPGAALQLQTYLQQLTNSNLNPLEIENLLNQWLQNPAVLVILLALIAGIFPLIEELLKTLGVWLFAGDRLTSAEGFISGTICGASFALWENLSVLSSAGEAAALTLVVRVGTGLLHIVTAGMIGWGIASAAHNRRYIPRLIGAYLAAGLLHCTWNAASIFVGAGTYFVPAGTALVEGQVISGIAVGVLVAIFLINLALLTFFNRRLRLNSPNASDMPVPVSQPGA